METSDLHYVLPPERIAQRPVEPRDAARLLVDNGPAVAPSHRHVRDLPELVGPGDLIVVNTTRVIRARLALRKPTGGAAEVLLLEDLGEGWEALVRPSRRVPPGTLLTLASGEDTLSVEVGEELGEGKRFVRIHTELGELEALERAGEVPLPPYVHAALDDPERYQTVYAASPGSVAAPTAGLHLTAGLLDACRARGAELAEVELSVGIGTFRPILTDTLEEHHMHAERYRVPAATLAACRRAERVLAVGTTTVRALESAAATGETEGRTELFIKGGHDWQVVGAMLTNFHMPRSSLLAMVDAFVGERWRRLYATALAEDYRFLSFGDAMLLRR